MNRRILWGFVALLLACPATLELVQGYRAPGDLGFTYFACGEDEGTLIAIDIPGLDEPPTFRRVTDEEYFGSDIDPKMKSPLTARQGAFHFIQLGS